MANSAVSPQLSAQKSLAVALLLVIAVGVVAYGNSFDVPFLFDDMHNIRNNTHLRTIPIELVHEHRMYLRMAGLSLLTSWERRYSATTRSTRRLSISDKH